MKKFFPVDSDCVLCLTDRKKSSTVWTDLSSGGNNGTIYGATTPPAATAGRLGYTFDGVDDSIDCGNGASLNITINDFSVSGWIYALTWGVLFDKSQSITSTRGFYTAFTSTGKREIGLNDGTYLTYTDVGNSLNTNQWYNIVFVFNRSSNLITYVNGVIDGTGNISSHSGNLNNSFSGKIGTYNATSSFFKGSLDGVRIYNRALSASEILNYYGKTRKFYGV